MQIPGVSGPGGANFSPFDPQKAVQDLVAELEDAVTEFVNNLGREGELNDLQSRINKLSEQLKDLMQKYKGAFTQVKGELEAALTHLDTFSQKDPTTITTEQLTPVLPSLRHLYNSL